MTDWAVSRMAENYQGRPRERLSAFLRQMYPGLGRDKRLAADLKISARSARNLFEDHWPNDDTYAAILRRFGRSVARVLTEPDIDPVLAELTEKEARLARELEQARALRREVEGLVESVPRGLAGDEAEVGPLNLDLFEGRDFTPRPITTDARQGA